MPEMKKDLLEKAKEDMQEINQEEADHEKEFLKETPIWNALPVCG